MSKIRINELARELEVKPSAIIDLLPELGVTEKKTHSSSIEEDEALIIRKRLAESGHKGEHDSEHSDRASMAQGDLFDLHVTEIPIHKVAAEEPKVAYKPTTKPPAEKPPADKPPAEKPMVASAAADQAAPPAPVVSSHAVESHPAEMPVARATHMPLRPPLASGSAPRIQVPLQSRTLVPPSIPIPPAAPAPPPPAPPVIKKAAPPPVAVALPVAPAQPAPSVPAMPAVPSAPAAPATPVSQKASTFPGKAAPIPTRPLPSAPRPGQILSGPRQPFPSGPHAPAIPRPPVAGAIPGAPRPMTSPSLPRPPMGRPPFAQGDRPSPQPRPQGQHPQANLGGQQQPGQGIKPPLAGQPIARPIVPPRQDILDRLRQQAQQIPAKGMPGAPTPRPPGSYMPQRPGAPAPGQPIYQGRVRPGQTIAPRPGGPGIPYPSSPGGGGGYAGGQAGRMQQRRGPHPTSPGRGGPGGVTLEPPVLPVATDTQRRTDAAKRRHDPSRDRESEREGKLKPMSRRHEVPELPPIDREITISEGITVKELSEKLGVRANLLIKKLVDVKKVFASINQSLDAKLAGELAREFGASVNKVTYEEEHTQDIDLAEDPKDLIRRAPVVTIMGHVDHGKTSLLDAIRQARVAEREAGGITQHIGAYQVEKNGKKIVFIDTPGHAAFTRMRARGAKVTDIVILVVAADDGVMPQTREAIDHAKAAGVPIIVAINKIDKPDSNLDRIKQQLNDLGLLAEDWGGDVVMVPVSAKAKTNLDLLLEMVLLVSEILDLKANPTRPGYGSVLEAKLDKGRGPVATVLVRNGVMRVGDFFICGSVFGKVRAMFDDRGNSIRIAEPSTPVEVLGLEALPEVGDTVQVVVDTAKAKQIVMYRESQARETAMAKNKRITLEQLHAQMKEGELKDLNLIIKTDVGGTAEVLSDTLVALTNDKVRVRVLHSGAGAITETDVLLATASNAIIIGFNVKPERTAQAVADREKVDIRLHSIIYEVTDQIKRAMVGLLDPVYKEVYRGRAEVREVFRISKVGSVAGCMIIDGTIGRDNEVRILRDKVIVHTGKVMALKRFKNDASEVREGFECGISIQGFNDLKSGDIIEGFVNEKVAHEAMP